MTDEIDRTPLQAPGRKVAITSLHTDPQFANLFFREKSLVTSLVAKMKQGFDRHRPIDVWRDGLGRGKHLVVEGHTRFEAAQKAGLTEVYVAYREFPNRLAALLFAAEQQGLRRNIAREVQCLSVLRALHNEPDYAYATTKALVATLGFAQATIDRARLLLKHGTEAEITEVFEKKHGLREAYGLMNRRRKKSQRADERPIMRAPKRPPVLTTLRNTIAKALDAGLIESPEIVRHLRAALDWLDGGAPMPVDVDDETDEDRAAESSSQEDR